MKKNGGTLQIYGKNKYDKYKLFIKCVYKYLLEMCRVEGLRDYISIIM